MKTTITETTSHQREIEVENGIYIIEENHPGITAIVIYEKGFAVMKTSKIIKGDDGYKSEFEILFCSPHRYFEYKHHVDYARHESVIRNTEKELLYLSFFQNKVRQIAQEINNL